MTTRPIDGRGVTVGQLFSSGARYRLDPYQREYDWERKNVIRLLDDLERRFTPQWNPFQDRTEINSYAPYFLGPYVYFEKDGVTYLVDGQQRITTLHLLLIHIRRLLQQQDFTTDANQLETLIRTVRFGQNTFTVDIEERTPLLEALMENKPYHPGPDVRPSVRNLLARSEDMEREFPPSLLGESLPYFHDWLLHRVSLVGIDAIDQRHGWEIFETMNDRGTRLTPVDLLKSFLLGNTPGSQRRRLNDAWRDMLSRLTGIDAQSPSDFVKDLLIGKYAHDRTDDVSDIERSFHEWIRRRHLQMGLAKPQDFEVFITDTLGHAAKRYCLLLAASLRPEPGLESLFYNQVNGIRYQHRLIMAANRIDDSHEDFTKKASLIASFLDLSYVKKLIRGHSVHGSDLDREIHDLIPALRTCRSPEDVARILGARVSGETFPDFPTFGLGSDNRQQVHYLLSRLTAFVDSETNSPDRIADYLGPDRNFQIEHIWANHDERYRDQVSNRRDFDLWRNRLGALLLLHRSDNASYRDAPYNVKLEHYPRQNMLAASLHPKAHRRNPRLRKFIERHDLAATLRPHPSDFTKEAIKTRQNLYQKLAEIIWNPRRLGLAIEGKSPKRSGVEVRTRAYYGVEIGNLIEAGLVQPGAIVIGRARATEYTATILEDGRIRTDGGAVFASPSSAGASVRGIKSCPGWDFWHLRTSDRDIPLRELRAELLRSHRIGP